MLPSASATKIVSNDEQMNLTNVSQLDPQSPANPIILIVTFVVCTAMTALTIVGNLVVILSVCIVRKLQTASNILIVSLAVSDIFVGLFIMPLALGKRSLVRSRSPVRFVAVLELNRAWILGSVMCDLWTSTDVLLCTSSILNFLVISIDRYFIINHPFKYAPMRKVKLLSFMIATVWILSALVSLPPILGWGRKYSRSRMRAFDSYCLTSLECHRSAERVAGRANMRRTQPPRRDSLAPHGRAVVEHRPTAMDSASANLCKASSIAELIKLIRSLCNSPVTPAYNQVEARESVSCESNGQKQFPFVVSRIPVSMPCHCLSYKL